MPDSSETEALRRHLLELLRGGHAHLDLDAALKDLPADRRGVRPEGAAHSPWEILEHLRIAQWDILEFSRNRGYVSPSFPEGYWPPTAAPPDPASWEHSLESVRQDLKAMQDLVNDAATDLYAKIPWGDGQTILREALLVADHNAYHLGQIVCVRQALGAWGG